MTAAVIQRVGFAHDGACSSRQPGVPGNIHIFIHSLQRDGVERCRRWWWWCGVVVVGGGDDAMDATVSNAAPVTNIWQWPMRPRTATRGNPTKRFQPFQRDTVELPHVFGSPSPCPTARPSASLVLALPPVRPIRFSYIACGFG